MNQPAPLTSLLAYNRLQALFRGASGITPARPPSKHSGAKTGKHGGPRIDRAEKRKAKIAKASRKRNRKQ